MHKLSLGTLPQRKMDGNKRKIRSITKLLLGKGLDLWLKKISSILLVKLIDFPSILAVFMFSTMYPYTKILKEMRVENCLLKINGL